MENGTRGQRWDSRSTLDERRDEILRSLGAFLRSHRLSSLKMQDIADQLGMTKGNLYYYFKNKQDILYHCHVKSMEVSLRALDQVEASRSPPSSRLRTLLEQHILGITDEVYGAVLLTDLESLAPPQRRRYIAMRDRFEDGIRKIMEAGISNGEFRSFDPRVAGFAFLGAINWISKWYRPDKGLTSQAIAEQFADLFIHSLLNHDQSIKSDDDKPVVSENSPTQDTKDIAGWKFVITDAKHGHREIWMAYIADFTTARIAFEKQAKPSNSKKISYEPITWFQLTSLGLAPNAVKLVSL